MKPTARKFFAEETDQLISRKVVEPVTTEWADRIVFAAQKNGPLHFYIDYRKQTAVTFHDSYPILSMDGFTDSLGELKAFSTLDATSWYW